MIAHVVRYVEATPVRHEQEASVRERPDHAGAQIQIRLADLHMQLDRIGVQPLGPRVPFVRDRYARLRRRPETDKEEVVLLAQIRQFLRRGKLTHREGVRRLLRARRVLRLTLHLKDLVLAVLRIKDAAHRLQNGRALGRAIADRDHHELKLLVPHGVRRHAERMARDRLIALRRRVQGIGAAGKQLMDSVLTGYDLDARRVVHRHDRAFRIARECAAQSLPPRFCLGGRAGRLPFVRVRKRRHHAQQHDHHQQQ